MTFFDILVSLVKVIIDKIMFIAIIYSSRRPIAFILLSASQLLSEVYLKCTIIKHIERSDAKILLCLRTYLHEKVNIQVILSKIKGFKINQIFFVLVIYRKNKNDINTIINF